MAHRTPRRELPSRPIAPSVHPVALRSTHDYDPVTAIPTVLYVAAK